MWQMKSNKSYMSLLLSIACIISISIKQVEAFAWKRGSRSSNIYYLLGELPMTYDESYEFCSLYGGILGEPRSSAQTQDINEIIDYDNNYWIGLTDVKSEGIFVWNSDGKDTHDYENWAANGNSSEPSGDGNCVHLYHGHDEKWNDEDCKWMEIYNRPILALCQKSTFF